MTTWMRFLLDITPAIWDLYEHILLRGNPDPEAERQIAMGIVRAAKDAQARREFEP